MVKTTRYLDILKYYKEILITILVTSLVTLTGTLSFLRTNWDSYKVDFFFWWSIVPTLVGLAFVMISIWQYWESKSQEEKNNAQVKVWMQDANGVREALRRIINDNLDNRYASTNDMGNAVWSIEATVFALYQNLYEERCVTEEEYRTRQKKLAEILDRKQFAELEKENTQVEQVSTK